MRNQTLTILMTVVAPSIAARESIPDRLVVLTFDDGCKSHFTQARPILKRHGFGATFFITEGFDFTENKAQYMTWEEIASLHGDGFEIGNHTRDHMGLDGTRAESKEAWAEEVREQIETIHRRCLEHGIPRPTTLSYPGNSISPEALPILRELGIQFARRGGSPEHPYDQGRGFAYEPGLDHPLLIPSAGDARPDWEIDDFRRAVDQAEFGRIAVIQFHGVPDLGHSWVNTPVERFEEYMDYLADNGFTVISLGALAKYVDPAVTPRDPDFVIQDRVRSLQAGESRDNCRPPKDDEDLRYWLQSMVWYHRYSLAEIRTATGLTAEEIKAALRRFDIREETRPEQAQDAPLLVLPYPGGRHPRIGFLDGAVRPQRETKISILAPWEDGSYVVVDVPEALRWHKEAQEGLLYLAHTHVDTVWTKEGIALEKLEWQRESDGSLVMERRLPNQVTFGTRVVPRRDAVHMEMWLVNGSREALSNLRVQNCIMLRGAPAFCHPTEENTIHAKPYIARRSLTGNRWIITAWEPCASTWFNPPCPCMHSDPQFPDCLPGETRRLKGWLSFYEGDDIRGELEQIEGLKENGNGLSLLHPQGG